MLGAWLATSPEVKYTYKGTPYFRSPGVAVISAPEINFAAVDKFIRSFHGVFSDEDAEAYILDILDPRQAPGESLAKFAGQLCYLSFGPHRSTAENAADYFTNIKTQAHGSIFEHVNVSILFWGIDRAVTHEIVRHRAGFGFSQVSQRYVSGRMLRFVEDYSYQADIVLHNAFEASIDRAAEMYTTRAERLVEIAQKSQPSVPATQLRKLVNQAARRCLPNETEAPILVTGNVRAWRNFIEQRANAHADVGIRRPAYLVAQHLKSLYPLLFSDYDIRDSKEWTVSTPYRKV